MRKQTANMLRAKIAALLLFTATAANAGIAICTITIWDLIKDNKYTLEQKFEYGTGDAPSLKKFDTPGNDYQCRLVFFKPGDGTMLSCQYLKDAGHTFFMSDRSILRDEKTTVNHLTFRHKSSHIEIKTACK